MSKTRNALYFTETIRYCEQKAINSLGISEDELMAQAGAFAFGLLKSHYPDVKNIAVFCGGGNNGGDGYVLALLAHQQNFTVTVYQFKALEQLPTAARNAAQLAINAGVLCQPFEDAVEGEAELIVDGLLGIGLHGEVRGAIAHAITIINESGLPVLSLDIPSGLDADTGCVLGACVKAAVTATFIAPKAGMYTADGPDHCGKVICHRLHLERCLSATEPAAYLIDASNFHQPLVVRRKNSHKSLYGHVLIIGGGPGMPGAVFLAAQAALRVGAGMVTVATLPAHAQGMLPLLPEVMVHAIDKADDLMPLLKKATVCVVGPGLGESAWASELFKTTIGAQLPLVIDASALGLLADCVQYDDSWVLTPHPGEAARLLHCSTSDVQANRFLAARRIQQKYGGCVVLKGVGSIINGHDNSSYVCTAGNPGMATAGMGDVLSGIIASLIAQGLSLTEATKLAVWLHATAADDAAAAEGKRGLIASDLMPYLRRRMNVLNE